jgi:hypothetical protein
MSYCMNGAPGYGKDSATLHSDSLEGSSVSGLVCVAAEFSGVHSHP